MGIAISKCGIFINKKWPYLGASPDGIVSDGAVLEIKCPYTARDMKIEEAITAKIITFLTFKNNQFDINKNHDYYYQVQGQLNICEKSHGYFATWTTKDMVIITIQRDVQFFENMVGKLKLFYHECLLPEIIDPRHKRNRDILDPDYIKNAAADKKANDTI